MTLIANGDLIRTNGRFSTGVVAQSIGGGGGKIPGVLVPVAVVAATGNPVGLIVGGAAHLVGESGSETLEGTAKGTAEEVAEELEVPFRDQGWI